MKQVFFNRENTLGIFKGFAPGDLEFHAELVLPYREDFQRRPMHGQYLLIELASPEEAVLGRITGISTDGRLALDLGEDYNIRAVKEERSIAEDLREQYLKYRINVRLLGLLRQEGNTPKFVPSLRRLPHLGSRVAYPSDEILKHIVGHYLEQEEEAFTPLGYYALGEFIYSGNDQVDSATPIQTFRTLITPKFSIDSLVSRRSFIFARAGFGKSNLNKYLFAELYRKTPTVKKRTGDTPVGTIIFDPDGEYFWPDDKGRPGLCDVPHLENQLVVFSDREPPSKFYGSFVLDKVKLDLREFDPSDVVGLALEPERQEQQNVRKLRFLRKAQWITLVELIAQHYNSAPIDKISQILGLEDRQEVEAYAARANMSTIVRMLHDSQSKFLSFLLQSLIDGKICVVDISKMRGKQGMIFAALILRRIFQLNQEEFIKKDGRTIPTIVVIEEAQSVLHEETSASEPFITWVKEGRKYDLGALMVTQQPGSISHEILSQGDNWFVFHLLSAQDLYALKKANGHFSDDILTSLLNEPIPGQGFFWSSASKRPYPIGVKIFSFEKLYSARDPNYTEEAIENYASLLRLKLQDFKNERLTEIFHDIAEKFLNDEEMMKRLKANMLSWGGIKAFILKNLPDVHLGQDKKDKEELAYKFVPDLLDKVCTKLNVKWETYRKQNPEGSNVTYVRLIS